ncbi:MAG: hypothetical protein ABI426_09010, partial [Flavobacterium sp.]
MIKTGISIAMILMVGLSAFAQKNTTTLKSKKMEISNKQKVVALLKSIETGASEPVGYINPNKYIQHN